MPYPPIPDELQGTLEQSLDDTTPRPGLFERFGEEVLNLPTELERTAETGLYEAGFQQPGDQPPKVEDWFKPPPAKTIPEKIAGGAATVVKSLPLLFGGEALGAGAAGELGLTGTEAATLRSASAFGASGATESPEAISREALIGAGFGAVEKPIASAVGWLKGLFSKGEEGISKVAEAAKPATESVATLQPTAEATNLKTTSKAATSETSEDFVLPKTSAEEAAAKPPPVLTLEQIKEANKKVAGMMAETPSAKFLNQSRQLKLNTILHEDDDEMILKAADRLDVFYDGTMTNGDKTIINFSHPSGPSFALEQGATYKDLKNKLAATLDNVNRLPTEEEATVVQRIQQRREVAAIPPTDGEGTFAVKAKVMYDVGAGEGPELAIVQRSTAGFSDVKTLDGTVWEKVPDSKLSPATKSIGQAFQTESGLSRFVDDGEKLATLQQDNEAKVSKFKLKQRPESGVIDAEVALRIGRYVAAPVVGSIVGASMSDEDHRLHGAVLGAISGGLVAKYGPRILRTFADAHPEIGNADSFPAKLKEVLTGVGEDAAKTTKLFTDFQNMAAAGAKLGAGPVETFARWMQKNYMGDPDVKRMLQKAMGTAQQHGELITDAVKTLAQQPNLDRETVGKFFTGQITAQELQKTVPQLHANLAMTARQAATALQKIAVSGMDETTKLAKKITSSYDKYLMTTYEAFTKGRVPTSEEILAAAKSVGEEFGPTEEIKVARIEQDMKEIFANRALYRGGLKSQGEAFGGVLARLQEITPEFKAMLGEVTDPLERMAASGLKLMAGARTAKFFDQIAEGVRENGLKMAYNEQEYASSLEALRSKIPQAATKSEVATLQSKLTALKRYEPLPFEARYGKLGGNFVDRKVLDGVQTFDSVFHSLKTGWGQQLANVTNLIKAGHTVYSPAMATRQVMSLPVLSLMARISPVDIVNAATPLIRKLAGKQTAEDVLKHARYQKLGIYYGDIIGGMVHQDLANMVGGKLDSLIGEHAVGRWANSKWQDFYRMPDLITRIASFEREESRQLASGVDAATAESRGLDFANKWAINYGAVTPGVRYARQLPFINQYLSFASEMARIVKNHAIAAYHGDMYSASVLTTISAVPFIIQRMTERYNLSDSDRKDWNKVKELLPEYSRQHFLFVTGRDAKGQFHYTDFTPIIPTDHWMVSGRAIGNGDIAAAFASNPLMGWQNTPLLNTAINQVTGRDIHTKADFTPWEISPWQNIKDRLNSSRRDLLPTPIGNDLDKVVLALTPNEAGGLGITNVRTGQSNTIGDLLQSYLTATRGYSANLSYLQAKEKAEAVRATQTLQMELRKVQLSDAAPEVKQRAVERFQTMQKKVIQNFQDRLGLTPSE